MSSKPNIRSIRISDDMAELIDRQAGNNFTEKWENLVTRCVWELPAQEARLKEVQARIRQEMDKLHDLQRTAEKLRQMEQSIKSAEYYIRQIEKQAAEIAGTDKTT